MASRRGHPRGRDSCSWVYVLGVGHLRRDSARPVRLTASYVERVMAMATMRDDQRPQGRRARRSTIGLLLAGLVAIGAAFAAYLLRDPLPHFLERRSRLASAVEQESV